MNDETFKKLRKALMEKKPRKIEHPNPKVLTVGVQMKKSDYSDVIKEFGYDLYGNNLIIEYNYGAKYIYKGVSKFEFDKFVYEKNKGKFLKEKIKNRCDYIKVK